MQYAGLVEGFYGTPWSWDARLEVAAEVAAAGGNLYVYAPKDDPRHRQQWREPYDRAETLEFERLVAKAPLRCAFAISPGLDIDAEAVDDRRRLVEKLRWAVATGFQLAVLALDDIPIAPGSGAQHAHLWLAVAAALDPVPVLLVPSDYTGTSPTPYLDELVTGLDGSPCSIGWTGPQVVNPVIDARHARGRAAACGDRAPVLWDNTPVNDAVMADRLHLGPYTGRPAELLAELDGIVLNPMIQARASLPTVLSAMAWARGDDPEHAWRDVMDRRGWRGFAEAIEGGRGRALLEARDLEGLDAWLAAVSVDAPGLEDEVAPWSEQLRVEVDLARRLLAAARTEDAFKAFVALGQWRTVQAHCQHSVLGARRSLTPAAAVGADGRFRGGAGILRDDNLLDLIARRLFG